MIKRAKREDGAALVEMAFVAPLLILIIFGALEFGLAFKERLTIASAANSAARTGATMGNRDDADMRILEAIEVGLYDQVDPSIIYEVKIFHASDTTGAMISGEADTYLFDASDPNCKWNPCPDPDPALFEGYGSDAGWPPDARDTTLDEDTGLDVLGVQIIYEHEAVTNLLPYLNRNFTERALVRLEPDVFGESS